MRRNKTAIMIAILFSVALLPGCFQRFVHIQSRHPVPPKIARPQIDWGADIEALERGDLGGTEIRYIERAFELKTYASQLEGILDVQRKYAIEKNKEFELLLNPTD